MKIIVVSAQVFVCPPPGYSGLEMIAWQVAKGLASLGHIVSLVAPEGSWCPGVNVIASGPPGKWDERMAFSNYWQKLLDCDAIIDHSWAKWSYGLKQEGVLKAPVLGVCHAPVNTMYQSLPPGIDKPCFVCISKDQATHFEALFSRPARHAHNGVDMDFYKPMGVKRTGRFLFLARFSTIKGPDLAIEACKKAEAGLDLIGDTSITNEPELFHRCKEMCDGEQIRMIGPANRSECVWWFNRNHVLLHPNMRFREPFGLSPVEAQACGCPVVAFDYGAMRETIKHRETGWLVKSKSEFDEEVVLVNSLPPSGGWGAMRSRCREWASQFSVENMCKRYEELCVEACNGGW